MAEPLYLFATVSRSEWTRPPRNAIKASKKQTDRGASTAKAPADPSSRAQNQEPRRSDRMNEPLLTVADQKEGLSLVYVKAVATRAGFLTSVREPDRDSVDLTIHAGGQLRPALDLQLKATTNIRKVQSGFFSFRLSIKNYDELRVETQTPRLLVVLELPEDQAQWKTLTAEELVLRRRAYWLSLQTGHEEAIDQQTVTVHIPEDNLFDVDALLTLMERSRSGEI